MSRTVATAGACGCVPSPSPDQATDQQQPTAKDLHAERVRSAVEHYLNRNSSDGRRGPQRRRKP